jgi:hypothetical protein
MAVCDVSSLAHNRGLRQLIFVAGVANQAHANQMIDMSGAVRRRISARSVLIAEINRLPRLCVLIVNPIPARRSIHLDLAGSGIYLVPLSALSFRPRLVTGWKTFAEAPAPMKMQ